LTIYPGSIERVDFSEEKEPKGFVMLQIAPKEEEENPIVQDSSKSSKTTDRQNLTSQNLFKTTYEFCPVPARSFCTIEINLCNSTMPQDDLLMAIHRSTIQDAVVRLIYHLRPEQVELIQDTKVRSALGAAHSYTIQADLVTQLSRSRLPELGVGATITPMEALQAYLINREDLRDLEAPILEAARALMGDEQGVMFGSSGDPMFGIDVQVPVKRSMEAIDFAIDAANTADVQLRLL
jgi:exonuclease SbcD